MHRVTIIAWMSPAGCLQLDVLSYTCQYQERSKKMNTRVQKLFSVPNNVSLFKCDSSLRIQAPPLPRLTSC